MWRWKTLQIGYLALILMCTHVFAHLPQTTFYTTSYYVTYYPNPTLLTKATALGIQYASLKKSRHLLLILDFGSPAYHVHSKHAMQYLFGGNYITDAHLAKLMSDFTQHYYQALTASNAHARSPIQLTIALGSSNYGRYITAQHGALVANVLQRLQRHLSKAERSKISYAAAYDMEPGWNSYATSVRWINGFRSVNRSIPIYDFGSADGCPFAKKGAKHFRAGICAKHWTLEQLWSILHGENGMIPIPEIYLKAIAHQWFNLSLYSIEKHHTRLPIEGILTQWRATNFSRYTNSPDQANEQLNALLNSNPDTKRQLKLHSDIGWDV